MQLAEPISSIQELWAPISPREIRLAYPPEGTAPGQDGITTKELKKVKRKPGPCSFPLQCAMDRKTSSFSCAEQNNAHPKVQRVRGPEKA